VANTLLKRGISIQGGSKHVFQETNFHVSKSPDKTLLTKKIPASLYLKEKPSFWGNKPWPCIGADVDAKARLDNKPFIPIPAQERYSLLTRKKSSK
jgi:hypothetical protein